MPEREEEECDLSTSLALSLRTLTLATAGVLLVLASPTWAIGPFCRSPSVPIPDTETGISDDLVVSATNTISDLDVSVDISHTFVGDLVVTLTHVDTGTSVIIIDRPGTDPNIGNNGCSSDNIVATLDDEAASPVENECAPTPPHYRGHLQPEQSLKRLRWRKHRGHLDAHDF